MTPSYVVVTHNIVSHANEIARSEGQGGSRSDTRITSW